MGWWFIRIDFDLQLFSNIQHFQESSCLSDKWLVYEEHLQCMRVNMIIQRDDEKPTSWNGMVNVKVERARICSKPTSLEGRSQNCFEKDIP